MAELNRIQQQVFDSLAEHNSPKGLSGSYQYYMYCCSGKRDVPSQEAFDEYLEELEEEGLIRCTGKDEKGAKLYALKDEIKHEASPIRGEAFGKIMEELASMSSARLGDRARAAVYRLLPKGGLKEPTQLMQVLIMAAGIGTEGKAQLNPPEKAMVSASFGAIISDAVEPIYSLMEQPLEEEAFGVLTVIVNNSPKEASRELLYFILAFAYADGEISIELADRLEKIFKPIL